MGAGYRILPLFDGSWAALVTMRKRHAKRFRLWLLVHHPHAPGGLPWYWWLCAGRTSLVPPPAIGALSCGRGTYDRFRSLEGEGWTLSPSVDESDFPDKEQYLKRPWLEMYLRDLRETSLRVIAGELLDPYWRLGSDEV